MVPLFLILLVSSNIMVHALKELPPGLSYEGTVHTTDHVRFLSDLTYMDDNGKLKMEHEIFERINSAITEADKFIVLDMFLFNAYYKQDGDYPKITDTIANALITQKQKHKNLDVWIITDEINITYGSHKTSHLERFEKEGFNVVYTNLEPLRDSNPIYSGFWRIFFQWFGQSGKGWLPNPLAENAPDVTVRACLELLNLKANHRKVFISDKTAIVSSANPHDESGFNSNIAFEMGGTVIGDLLTSEQAALDLSESGRLPALKGVPKTGELNVQVLTEGKIQKHILREIDKSAEGDTIWVGMFYLADRDVIEAMDAAGQRGATVNIILDPNTNAFGTQKAGLPNIPVAAELIERGNDNLHIRWYNTGKEQYHSKLIYFQRDNEDVVIGGSANFTRRNLDDYNLETDVKIWGPSTAPVMQDVGQYFTRLWNNKGGKFTVHYKENQNTLTPIKYIGYWLQNIFQFTTF
ncbi:phospholipase [Bacillus sp. T33-2]|nr:phospholipase [Bacillus sp. T33-2]